MVKEVYDISQTLTPEQTATAFILSDNPGFGEPLSLYNKTSIGAGTSSTGFLPL